jgi:uncharacterized repeat protein (TIGR01451 family)
MKTFIKLNISLLLMLFAMQVHAVINLKNVAEVEITEVDSKGKQTVKRIPAGKVIPGTEVIYTITATNTGDQNADNITVTDPIPENTVYVEGSAFGSGTEITFSVDGGKTYDKPAKLSVPDATGTPRRATAEDYTHIRWKFQFSLKPGQEAPVWFRARVK